MTRWPARCFSLRSVKEQACLRLHLGRSRLLLGDMAWQDRVVAACFPSRMIVYPIRALLSLFRYVIDWHDLAPAAAHEDRATARMYCGGGGFGVTVLGVMPNRLSRPMAELSERLGGKWKKNNLKDTSVRARVCVVCVSECARGRKGGRPGAH